MISDSVPDCPQPFGPVQSSRRLIVDHIVLENFKSYAGRQVIGPFHEVIILKLRKQCLILLVNLEFYFYCWP